MSALCYRHRGSMKTDRQIGSKGQRSGKSTLGFSRSPRRASSQPHALLPATPATDRRVLTRLRQVRSCGPFASDFPCPTSGERLIANLELESNPTHRKHSPLRISNRKFSRVCDSDSTVNFCQLVTHHSSLTTALLIYGSAIKTPANPQGFNDVRFSNRR